MFKTKTRNLEMLIKLCEMKLETLEIQLKFSRKGNNYNFEFIEFPQPLGGELCLN